ncbi:MAG TPA: preprotein translocase subunit SecG [Geobacteraceae bacterium]
MTILLTILHLTVSIALIAIVLLQSGKGAEMGATFGAGGSQSVFGAGGGTTFMSKLTTSAAIIFMLTSLTLAYISGHSSGSSVMSSKAKAQQKSPAPAAPAMPGQPAAPGQPGAPGQPATPAQQGAPVKNPAPAPQPSQPATPAQQK